MQGLMQDRPLLISALIEHAAAMHPDAEIVSRTVEGPLHRCYVRRHPQALEAGRECAGDARREAGRSHCHAGVERLPAYGALLRRVGHGGRAAHDQSATVSGTDRLHREPCRGQLPVLRPHVRAADRIAGSADEVRQGLHRDDRPRAHAVARRAKSAVLRGLDRRGVRRLRLAGARRTHRVVALLHVRHDGQPEGRALLPSVDGAAFVRGLHGRWPRPLVGRVGVARGADVPRQRVGHALCGRDVRGEAGAAGPGARRQERLRADEGRESDARAGRAHRLAHAVPACRCGGSRIRSATSRCGAWSSEARPRRGR